MDGEREVILRVRCFFSASSSCSPMFKDCVRACVCVCEVVSGSYDVFSRVSFAVVLCCVCCYALPWCAFLSYDLSSPN